MGVIRIPTGTVTWSAVGLASTTCPCFVPFDRCGSLTYGRPCFRFSHDERQGQCDGEHGAYAEGCDTEHGHDSPVHGGRVLVWHASCSVVRGSLVSCPRSTAAVSPRRSGPFSRPCVAHSAVFSTLAGSCRKRCGGEPPPLPSPPRVQHPVFSGGTRDTTLRFHPGDPIERREDTGPSESFFSLARTRRAGRPGRPVPMGSAKGIPTGLSGSRSSLSKRTSQAFRGSQRKEGSFRRFDASKRRPRPDGTTPLLRHVKERKGKEGSARPERKG